MSDVIAVYSIAEKFKSLQGEGVYTGTPMAFIRTTGCSVGKKICQHCDTVFEQQLPWQGGGSFSADQLVSWSDPYNHICLTGGEPFDHDLMPLLERFFSNDLWPRNLMAHIESSGTNVKEALRIKQRFGPKVWLCISPKPGFDNQAVSMADEIKIIVPGLGSPESLELLRNARTHKFSDRGTFRWPDIEDALRWSMEGHVVFLQPRNGKSDVDYHQLRIVQDLLNEHPRLRLSVQMHKILKVQ